MTTFDHGTCESLLSLFDPFVVFGRTTNQPNTEGEKRGFKRHHHPSKSRDSASAGFGGVFLFGAFFFRLA